MIKVAYDIAVLASEYKRFDRKSGIFRVTEEILYELGERNDVHLSLVGVCGGTSFFKAMKVYQCVKSLPELNQYDFFGIIKNRFGLRHLYDLLYVFLNSEEISRSPAYSPRKLIPRSVYKLIREIGSYLSIDSQKFDIIHSSYH